MLITEPLLETVRDFLRSNLSGVGRTTELQDKLIRITNDQKVPPYSGEEFINVYGCTCSNEFPLGHETRKEVYSLKIGITRRLVGIPTDSSAEAIYTYTQNLMSRSKSSMAKRAYEIIRLLDGSWGIVGLLRQFDWSTFTDDENFCILTPLGYAGSAELEEVYAEHFYGEDDSDRPAGLFLELTFDGLEAYFNKYPE